MSNTNPLVAQLIKLLPFLGRNVCYSDRELAMKRFRRMLAEQPNAFTTRRLRKSARSTPTKAPT